MKKTSITIIACFLSMFIFGQVFLEKTKIEPSNNNSTQGLSEQLKGTCFLTEPNPDYVNYMKKLESGEINKEEGATGFVPSPVRYNFDGLKEKSFKNLPASYDLRSEGRFTPAKNQGNTPACWAFAACASVESHWMTSGLPAHNLSEQNVATCTGFDINPAMSGGNADMITSYFTRLLGPVLETDHPYALPGATNCVSGLAPAGFVNQARYLPPKDDPNFNKDLIKQAIMKYGAIFTSNHWVESSMNYGNATYYYSGTAPVNHGITLIGWDDNRATAGGTGAWIVKNSHGATWGDGTGCFYMSYNDSRGLHGQVTFWPSYIQYDSNMKVYQHDKHGMLAAYENIAFDVKYAIAQFTATSNQQLTQIGTAIYRTNTDVTIDIYSSFDGTTLNESDKIASIPTKNCYLPGFHTFNLSTPLNLTSGQNIFVKIEYGRPSIPAENNQPGYTSGFVLASGKYWISNQPYTNWVPTTHQNLQFNIPIKAYVSNQPSTSPIADFSGTPNYINENETVTFTDLSKGNVTSWNWSFPGGSPSTSTSQNPTVTYSQKGIYDVTLIVSDGTVSNTYLQNEYVRVLDHGFSMDFEACRNFSTEFFPWKAVDLNGANTYAIGDDFLFPGQGQPMAFIAFNWNETLPFVASDQQAQQGVRIGASFASMEPPNNAWLISNKLKLGSGSVLSLWVKSLSDAYGLERYKVGVSTTNDDPSSFNFISSGSFETAPTTWTQRTYSLEAYDNQDVYIAINCVSDDAWMFMIDDIQINTVTDNYQITQNSKVNIFPNPANDFITITNAENKKVEILNVLGEIVLSAKTTSSHHNIDINNLSNGTYFVKINSEIFKINILK